MSIGTDGRIGPKGFEELPPEVAAWERAVAETNRLQRELNITNADHIALWLEANTIPDEPMSQCISWLACRIVEAHERAVTAQPVDETERLRILHARFNDAIGRLPFVAEALAKGYQFNAYESASNDDDADDDEREYQVCIGPVSDFRFLFAVEGMAKADLVEAALKIAALQHKGEVSRG